MLSVRSLAPLLLLATALAACGTHLGPDARTVGARQAAGAAPSSATVNAGATIEAAPSQRLADSRAESAHVSALVRCDRLSAAAREACRDQADADYQSTLIRAMQLNSDPQASK
jgi:hypothetical protein